MWSQKFEQSLGGIFDIEGLYSDVPGDHGGPTNFGITQRTYDLYRRSKGLPSEPVKSLTRDVAADVYKTIFWDGIRGDELSPSLSFVLFDGAVHMGPQKAIKILQEIVGVPPDGIFGPMTMQAIGEMGAGRVVPAYIRVRYDLLMRLAEQPGQGKFRKGWIRRILLVKQYVTKFKSEVNNG